jgi:hypothetical protein
MMHNDAMSATTPPVTPEDAVYSRAVRLLTVQHAVAEICGGRKVDADPQALRDAVLQIRRIVKSIDGAYATFIGGLAVQELGYVRWTDDVDVVVDSAHYTEVLEKLRSSGFVLKANFTLQNRDTGAVLDVLREGAKLKDSKYPLPHPSRLGPNTGFATLAAIVWLKIDAHRRQDLADVVALLKKHLEKIDEVRATLPAEMLAEYDQFAAEARHEMGQ